MFETLFFAGLGFLVGGVLKGATGAGAPILAVPLLALFTDVPTAVALFAIPNLVPNLWQAWSYRADLLPAPFVVGFGISGGIGAAIGTWALANLSSDLLLLLVAFAVFAYVGFRILRADWVLGERAANRLVLPAGTLAGVLQGASGISAPISITFLNAMGLTRPQFIATISVFFAALAVIQIPLLAVYGILTGELALISTAALAPLLGGMPIGAFLARHISKQTFDRVILALLTIIALRLVVGALF